MLQPLKIPNRTIAPTLVAVILSLAGCAGNYEAVYVPEAGPRTDGRSTSTAALPTARIIAAATPLQCVPYARSISDIAIRGDAWTWWGSATGRYPRDNRPTVGAVLVLKRTDRIRYGHVAVVSRVVSSREILVNHANWLNRGRIHLDMPVRDVSPDNDWSVVRLWYAPGNTFGKRRYAAYGFIHHPTARSLRLLQPAMQGPDVRILQERLVDAGFDVTADGIFGRRTRDALVSYQGRMGLDQDGVAGPKTRARLGI